MRTQHLAAASLLFLGTALTAHAQDTRTVTEPVIPPSCTVLHATKTGTAEKLDAQYEKTTDTALIQKALDHCKPGMAVELALTTVTFHESMSKQTTDGTFTSNAFLTGSLELREGVTLLIDKGVTLYGSRDPKDYDPNPSGAGPLLCGTLTDISRAYVTAKDPKDPGAATGKKMPEAPQGRTCKPLITINVKNAAIMGDGIIDGRGGAVVLGHDYTWWQMARAAEPKQLAYYSGKLILASHADNFILYRITLHNSLNFHVSVNNTDGFTAWGVHLQTPTVKGTDARNTDGIDPGTSSNITIAHSWIDNGDDNIAIKARVTHMSVLDNHFYSGHGMSIGSEIVDNSYLLVDGLTEDHTSSGIRIKSNAARGGPAHDLVYKNVCMRNVQMPIAISPFYNNGTTEAFTDPNVVGDRIPDYKSIKLENIVATTPGDVLIAGKDKDHITEIALNGVYIADLKPEQVHSQFAKITVGPSPVNFAPKGDGVTVTQIPGPHSLAIRTCTDANFPPYQ